MKGRTKTAVWLMVEEMIANRERREREAAEKKSRWYVRGVCDYRPDCSTELGAGCYRKRVIRYD